MNSGDMQDDRKRIIGHLFVLWRF